MTMKQDLADLEKDIRWPEGFNPSQADLFSHNALLINASCQRIRGHIVDATKWPPCDSETLAADNPATMICRDVLFSNDVPATDMAHLQGDGSDERHRWNRD